MFLLSSPVETAVPPLGAVLLAGERVTVAGHAGMGLLVDAALLYLPGYPGQA